MWRRIVVVLIAAVVIVGAGAAGTTAISQSGPTVEELTRDIEEIDAQLTRAEEFAGQYAIGSLIRTQSDLEVAILRSTRAMLDQKRLSWLRGISLSYVVLSMENRERPTLLLRS